MARETIEAPAVQERRLRMSYEDFLALGEEVTHAEWVNGEVIIFVPPKWPHQRLVRFLSSLLGLYVDLFRLGEVVLAPFEMRLARSAREPDLLFVAASRLDRLSDDRLDGPADLVIELISDDSVTRDLREKFAEFERERVSEYWVFDPRPGKLRARFFQLSAEGVCQEAAPDNDGRYRSTAVPGFWLRPEWLWQEPLPNPARLMAEIAPHAWRDPVKEGDRSPAAIAAEPKG